MLCDPTPPRHMTSTPELDLEKFFYTSENLRCCLNSQRDLMPVALCWFLFFNGEKQTFMSCASVLSATNLFLLFEHLRMSRGWVGAWFSTQLTQMDSSRDWPKFRTAGFPSVLVAGVWRPRDLSTRIRTFVFDHFALWRFKQQQML